MNTTRRKLTLYPARYQIKVPGRLDAQDFGWDGELTISYGCECGSAPVTTLRGTVDQAALQGLLRQLYARGLPIISVTWLEDA